MSLHFESMCPSCLRRYTLSGKVKNIWLLLEQIKEKNRFLYTSAQKFFCLYSNIRNKNIHVCKRFWIGASLIKVGYLVQHCKSYLFWKCEFKHNILSPDYIHECFPPYRKFICLFVHSLLLLLKLSTLMIESHTGLATPKPGSGSQLSPTNFSFYLFLV